MKSYSNLIKGSNAREIEMFAMEQARDVFGFDYRYRIVPNYAVSMYGYGSNLSPGAVITVQVKHKNEEDPTFQLYHGEYDEEAVVARSNQGVRFR